MAPEWQPARLIEVHGRNTPELGEYLSESELQEMQKKVVMIRPVYPSQIDIDWLRAELDCPDGKNFFQIRDDSSSDFIFVCEHEIQTD